MFGKSGVSVLLRHIYGANRHLCQVPKLKVNYPAEFKFTIGNGEKEGNVAGINKTESGLPNIISNTNKTDLFDYVIESWTGRERNEMQNHI